MPTKNIVWEHWNSKESEDPISKMLDQEEDDEYEEDSYEDVEPQNNLVPFIDSRPMSVITPFGSYPVESKLKPSDRWDCWIGNTNFTITEEIALKIEAIEGISSLRIMDRYAFCVGIGKLFDIRDVRIAIEDILYEDENLLEREDVKRAIDDAKIKIGDKKFWSIYIDNTGDISWIGEDDVTEEYLAALDFFEQMKNKNGGLILNSGE